FINHAPLGDELPEISDPDKIKSKIVTANLVFGTTWHLGFPIHYLQAIRDIIPGEQFCSCYRRNYLQSLPFLNQRYFLFNIHGEIIATLEKEIFPIIRKKDKLNVETLEDTPRSPISFNEFRKEYSLSFK